jgi:putative DNA primase/helicase
MSNLILSDIPSELKETAQWVCWKGVLKENGKISKLPIDPKTGDYAKTNNPATWGTVDEAIQRLKNDKLHGIGFVFSKSDPFVGIDLDNCYDPVTKSFSQYAENIIRQFESYTEYSPSGKGVHIIVKGKLNGPGHKNGSIEIYDQGRFFTFTGNTVENFPLAVTDKQKVITKFLEDQFSPNEDDNIIQKALKAVNGEKFCSLWEGDFSGYPSQSEADMALCKMLAFYTNGDAEKIDRLFRKSGLYREKWDREDYRRTTLQKITENKSTPEPKTEKISSIFNLTESGNAERLVFQHGKDILYCGEWKVWLIWDGIRWSIDRNDYIKILALKVVRSIYQEVESTNDYTVRRNIEKHAKASESEHAIKAMINLAKPMVPVKSDDLDNKHMLLNCPNGTVDLRTGELREHRRNDFLTKVTPVNFNPYASHAMWDNFLKQIFSGDEELIEFIQRAIGYSLTGSTIEQCFFILYGHGANGKSTFLQTINQTIGEYALQTPTETLLAKNTNSIRNDVARLKGSRFVTASEAEADQQLAEKLIKEMTGGDTMSARFLHKEFFEFKPTHKLFLGTNYKPEIKGTDHAIWRRIRLVPFNVTITENEQDPYMLDKLCIESEGILAWAIRGCLLWNSERLGMPQAVKQAIEIYRSEMDVITQFVDDCCEKGTEFMVTSSDLYAAFKEWCEKNGESVVSIKKLNMRLKELEYESIRIGTMKQRGLKGLKLIQIF